MDLQNESSNQNDKFTPQTNTKSPQSTSIEMGNVLFVSVPNVEFLSESEKDGTTTKEKGKIQLSE